MILKGHPFSAGRAVLPGMAVAVLAAMAAEFLSDHNGAPSMLMAILIGLPPNFLSDDARTQPGLALASRNVLRLGGALLGVRIGIDTILGLGHVPLLIVVAGVPVTILFGIALAWLIRQSPGFGFPTGGAVAICGASAAMAISAILPPSESRDRNLSFTVITVTIMSTLATILYPVLASGLRLDPATTGLLPVDDP